MDDEIDSVAELIERAQLREVAILRVAADRRGSRELGSESLPEELRAPDSPDDFAAIQLGTRLSDNELVVTLEVRTCNAHADFLVEAEAIFFLPVPVALGKDEIVHDFTEKVGAATIFPYTRAAVASLAAQVSVPASPLPLLPPGGMELLHDDEPSAPEVPDGVLVTGTYARTNEDGTIDQLGEFFIDTETGNLVRFGADDPDVEEFLSAMGEAASGSWVQIASAGDETWRGLIREHGIDEARALAESIRPVEGDEAADGALARIESAAWNIRLDEAVLALNDAMNTLDGAVSAGSGNGSDPELEASLTPKLIDAATNAIARWAEYRDL